MSENANRGPWQSCKDYSQDECFERGPSHIVTHVSVSLAGQHDRLQVPGRGRASHASGIPHLAIQLVLYTAYGPQSTRLHCRIRIPFTQPTFRTHTAAYSAKSPSPSAGQSPHSDHSPSCPHSTCLPSLSSHLATLTLPVPHDLTTYSPCPTSSRASYPISRSPTSACRGCQPALVLPRRHPAIRHPHHRPIR